MSGTASCKTGFHIWDAACWSTDESHILLTELIGYDLDSVLNPGTTSRAGGTVLNSILYYFNTGLLSAAFFLFSFILVAGVIYTAQDGQFLGKKWGSAWIPLRAVFGTLMLFPVKASGFCFAQYLMLMATYVGIGLANFVWYGVVSDIVTGQVVPIQDVTVRMQLVFQLGQLLMTDVLDDALGGLIANNAATSKTYNPDGSVQSANFIVARQIPITSSYFSTTSSQSQSNWAQWFPSSLPSTYCYPDPSCGTGSTPYATNQDAITKFGQLIAVNTGTGYSSGTDGSGNYVQAYVGTMMPAINPATGYCEIEAFPGNCVSFANSNVSYLYNTPSVPPVSDPCSSTDSTCERNYEGSKLLASVKPLLNSLVTNQYNGISVSRNANWAGKNASCFTLSAAPAYQTHDNSGCINPSVAGSYVDPTSPHYVNYNTLDSAYMKILQSLLASVVGSDGTPYTGPYRALFTTSDPSTGSSAVAPLSSSFGYACGYSDMAANNIVPPMDSQTGGICLPTDSLQACNAKVVAQGSSPSAQKFNIFTSGGWFCAGNRYLQLDDQLGVNSKMMQNIVQVFVNYQNTQTYQVTANDLGSYIFYVYAVGTFDNAGNLSFSDGHGHPPVTYKLNALHNPPLQDITLLTFGNLLTATTQTNDGVQTVTPSLMDQAIAGLCANEALIDATFAPGSDNCKLLVAYASRLENLLKDMTNSLSSNNAIGSRVLMYLNLNYLLGNQGISNAHMDPTKILNKDTVVFLYNLLSYGLYNGFLKSTSYQTIPANLPAPPVNPVAVSAGNTVLDSLFAGLLGSHLSTSNTVYQATSSIFHPMITAAPPGQPSFQLPGDAVPSTAASAAGSSDVSQTGWLSAIYSLGMKCPTPGSSSYAGAPTYCQNSVIQQQYSMIQTAQVIGVGLIGGALDSMENAFSSLTAEVMTIANDYASELEKAASQGALWHGLMGSVGDVASNYIDNSGPIAMAAAEANMMIAFANFSLQLMWLPIILFVITAIFSAGLSFAVMIPLTPFILFWAGKVAWILLFIEALLAAPLMALGIVYPDGHDLFGQSEPGIKLAVGMILMPVLMVIGLFMGISLTYVVISFTATGFQAVMQSIMAMTSSVTTSASQTQGIMGCFLILFYSYILTMAFEKCFSAIHVLPEKVLQWIGIQGQKFGEQEGQQMKSQMQQAGKEGAQAGGQSMTQGIQAKEQVAKATGEGAFKKGEAFMGAVNRATDSARGGIGGGMAGR